MIRYLKHTEIDKAKWDECIDRSVNGIIYSRSWYLDIVCPGWEALIENDYTSVFPLTHRKKYFIRYLFQPYFTQQLGLFSRNHLTVELVGAFLKAIPQHFKLVSINLNSLNKLPPNFSYQQKVNLELDLVTSVENILRNYDQNTRRNVKKALSQDLKIIRKVDPDELIALFQGNFGGKEGVLKFSDYSVLRKLMNVSLKKKIGLTLGVKTPDDQLRAAVFFLKDKNRWIFHFAASDRVARENGAMFLLIDSFIREHAGETMILDFEGSNDKNVARFYKGFGAIEVHYSRLTMNRLPLFARTLLYLKNRTRST